MDLNHQKRGKAKMDKSKINFKFITDILKFVVYFLRNKQLKKIELSLDNSIGLSNKAYQGLFKNLFYAFPECSGFLLFLSMAFILFDALTFSSKNSS